MNVNEFDRKVRPYLASLGSTNSAEAIYGARYAHNLVFDPENAVALAEASTYGIRKARRAAIRKTILSFNADGRL